MWPYHFVTPPPEQLEIRRQQLNFAGLIAWLSPVVLLLLIAIIRVASRVVTSEAGGNEAKAQPHKPSLNPPTTLTVLYRRLSWILTTTWITEFGPLYIQLLGILYAIWLLYLSSMNTGDDYMHLTKQLGHVAVAQLPWQYLLSFKTHRSPITLVTGLTHERLNAVHRLFGRLVHTLIAGHSILYLNFFVQAGLLEKALGRTVVRLGIAAFWIFNFLGLLATPVVRKKAYHALFYRSHVLLSAALPVVLWFHQPWTRWYLGQAAVFWVASGWARRSETVNANFKVEEVADQVLKVTVDLPRQSEMMEQWVPGQHVYLSPALGSVIGPRNPFTVVNLDRGEDGNCKITLVIRKMGGPGTSKLSIEGKSIQNGKVMIEGPYGEASEYVPTLLADESLNSKIVLVAGGVGATYALPIYLALVKAMASSDAIKMLWLVKTLEDAKWGIELLKPAAIESRDVEIHVTQRDYHSSSSGKEFGIPGVAIINSGRRPNMASLLESTLSPKADRGKSNGAIVGDSKRDSRKIKKSYEPVTVLVCGPPGLSQELRREFGKHVLGYGRKVRWYEEQFGLGGS